MKNIISQFFLILIFIFLTSSLSLATRPDPTKDDPEIHPTNNKKDGNSGGNDGSGGFFGPGSGDGFHIPGFDGNWPGNGVGGYGSGYGGPKGGHSKNGVIRPTVVCKDKGPCYKKKLTCPAKCFTSYSHSGKGYGGGGGGGGCTMDCKKCVAYC